jgi:hypothetical protein
VEERATQHPTQKPKGLALRWNSFQRFRHDSARNE